MAVDPRIGERVDGDVHRLTRAHPGQLRLLEVRHEVDRIERHHGHQLGSGLDVLADPQGPGADRAIDRGGDGRVAQVEPGLLFGGAIMLQLRRGFGPGSLQHVDLLSGSGERRACLQQARRSLNQ